jgi:hypothetical protein
MRGIKTESNSNPNSRVGTYCITVVPDPPSSWTSASGRRRSDLQTASRRKIYVQCGRGCGHRRSSPSARTSPARSSLPLVEVEARVAVREGAEPPSLVRHHHRSWICRARRSIEWLLATRVVRQVHRSWMRHEGRRCARVLVHAHQSAPP